MELRHSFDVLAEVIASYESGGGSIRAVETTTDGAGAVAATLDVTVDRCGADGGGPPPASAAITPEGELAVEYSPATVADVAPTGDDDRVTETGREASVTGDGDLVLSVDLRIEPAAAGGTATRGSPATTGGSAAAGSRGDTGSAAPRDASQTDDQRDDDGAAVATGGGDGVARDDGPATGRESRDGRGDGGTDEAGSPATALGAVRDDSVPPFEDVPYLRRLYETCDTFAEMSRHIEMDVSAETVRRYMTEADVHEPATYETSEDESGSGAGEAGGRDTGDAGDGGSRRASEPAGGRSRAEAGSTVGSPPQTGGERTEALPSDEHLVADGLGLPADLELRDVVDAVVDARCLYDVTRSLDLDQDRTRELLVQLNLLDLVSHRLSTVREQDTSFEDVAARIRQCSQAT